jgi:uncharacterized protein involved in response to NO
MTHPVVLQKGFRPFFLFGAAMAAVLVPWWVAHCDDVVALDSNRPGFEGISWHTHEMVFGVVAAILAGFLLTATENWTSRPTARGWFLAALVLLWGAGRGIALDGPLGSVAALFGLSFLPALTIAVGLPILITRRSRNYLLLAVLPALWLCDIHFHLVAEGLLPAGGVRSDLVAVDLVVLVMVIITGRIVPLFTRNATGDERIRSHRPLDLAAITSVIAVIAAEIIAPTGMVMALVAAIAAALLLARCVFWGALKTLGRPILWILHLGHAWLVAGLALKALAAAGVGVPPTIALHALTVGAMGTLIIGMLCRVTVGHTGRAIVTSAPALLAFLAISVAAVARVVLPLAAPSTTKPALWIAAVGWTVAFVAYLAGHGRMLVSPRPDGKEG